MNSNELGKAHTGQRTLSEATSDLAGQFGFDLVGEMIGKLFGVSLSTVKKPALAAKQVFEIEVEDEA